MNKRRIILFSVAPAVALGLIISLTVIVTIPREITQPYLRVIEPKDGAEVSGLARITIDYSDNLVGRIKIITGGKDSGEIGGSSPLSVDIDTTSLVNGPHFIEFQATDLRANITISEKRVYIVNNPTYRTQDFIYEYNHSIDISGLAEALIANTGLKVDDNIPVFGITSEQDPCGKWVKVKIHFYDEVDVKEAASYTKISSTLPLTQEQIEKIDSIAASWDKRLEPDLQSRTGRTCPTE